MKYFTPDLLSRFGSSDDAVADAAYSEWEDAQAKYLAELDSIRQKLPAALQFLLDNFNLHDARVRTLDRPVDEEVQLFLELVAPKGTGVLLRYRLADNPAYIDHAQIGDDKVPLEWAYDELSLLTVDGVEVCEHAILFSTGEELRLLLHDVGCEVFQRDKSPKSFDQSAPRLEEVFA